jgi:hypothetical protein
MACMQPLLKLKTRPKARPVSYSLSMTGVNCEFSGHCNVSANFKLALPLKITFERFFSRFSDQKKSYMAWHQKGWVGDRRRGEPKTRDRVVWRIHHLDILKKELRTFWNSKMWNGCWNISKLGEWQHCNISTADLEACWNLHQYDNRRNTFLFYVLEREMFIGNVRFKIFHRVIECCWV